MHSALDNERHTAGLWPNLIAYPKICCFTILKFIALQLTWILDSHSRAHWACLELLLEQVKQMDPGWGEKVEAGLAWMTDGEAVGMLQVHLSSCLVGLVQARINFCKRASSLSMPCATSETGEPGGHRLGWKGRGRPRWQMGKLKAGCRGTIWFPVKNQSGPPAVTHAKLTNLHGYILHGCILLRWCLPHHTSLIIIIAAPPFVPLPVKTSLDSLQWRAVQCPLFSVGTKFCHETNSVFEKFKYQGLYTTWRGGVCLES